MIQIHVKKTFIFLQLLFIGLTGNAQHNANFIDFIEILEMDIVFNQYISDEIIIEKINELIQSTNKSEFNQKDILLNYTQVNLSLLKDSSDMVLYELIELTEVCDTTNSTEIRIYLGSLLQISEILRNDNAVDLSYKYLLKGIQI